jgi:hypothetical protein
MIFVFRFVVMVLLLSLSGSPACGSQSIGGSYRYYDPLLWAHLIVTGEVLAVTTSQSTTEAWGMTVSGGPTPIGIETVRIRVDSILKGVHDGGELSIAMFSGLHGNKPTPVSVGSEVLIAAFFNKKAGCYQLRNYSGLFLKDGNSWAHPDPSLYDYFADQRKMTKTAVETRVSSVAPDNLAREADIILIGTLRSISKKPQAASGSLEISWTMDIDSLLKGDYPNPSIEFSMLNGGRLPDWAVPVPQGASGGEKWIVFLTRQGNRLIPFAGLNGMLKVEGRSLIYDSTVEYKVSRESLEAVIKDGKGDPSSE